eukprot:TRINITY_DN1844_c0_g1_i3.p1 TRINITY_DN1844_c0_g1~~TRINITY_DN1844_c0_g1_i3.p1  ORF type:complete len:1177 (-),score=251.27 TRINITY_DN1844_c0_g1_i3:9-3503(-)
MEEGEEEGVIVEVEQPDEVEVIQPPVPKRKAVGFLTLFRHSDALDKMFIITGVCFASAQGAMMPVFSILMGNIINAFHPQLPSESVSSSSENGTAVNGTNVNDTNVSSFDYGDVRIGVDMPELMKYVIIMFAMAAAAFMLAFTHTVCFALSSLRQSIRIRQLYFKAVLAQEMGWHDSKKAGELSSRIGSDTQKIQEALGEKVGVCLTQMATFVAGWTVGLIKGWKMSLVIISVTPLMMVSAGAMSIIMKKFTTKGQSAYANAGGVAEEVIACIRTVTSFGLQKKETRRYEQPLAQSKSMGLRKGFVAGGTIGGTLFILFCSYGLAFWYGSKLIRDGEMSAGKVTTVFFAIMMGAMALGQAAPNFQTFSEGQGAAYDIFAIIDRKSQISPFTTEGAKPEITGQITLQAIRFNYPTRPEAKILRGLSLTIERGQTVALVGPSGCGKSTVIGLIQRLYDTLGGLIKIDGHDIRELNTKHLRQHIGIVGQEPVLFAMSIRDNIALGSDDRAVSDEEIIKVAKQANAHKFITKLPQQYNTMVGERGVALSGGQKQRIAIARALIKNPKILLLDEATSALDTESEAVVQDALDKASQGRTTIIIAHRLTTVQGASKIYVLNKGRVAEAGTHAELLALGGLYFTLVRHQQLAPQGKGNHGGGKESVTEEIGSPLLTGISKRPSAGSGDAAVEDKTIDPVRQLLRQEKEIDSIDEVVTVSEPKKKKKEKAEKIPWNVVPRAFMLMKPTWPILAIAVVLAAFNGALFPAFAFVFSEMVNVLVGFNQQNETEWKHKVMYWAFGFVGIGVAMFVANTFQMGLLTANAETLSFRLRRRSFRAILRQNIGWFDDPENSTGVLSTRLSTDATLVDGATGGRVGIAAQALAAMITGIVVAFVGTWRLALVILAMVPIIGVAMYFHTKFLVGNTAILKKAYEKSGEVAVQAIEACRTVTMISQEDKFVDFYRLELRTPARSGYRSAFINGAGVGVSQSVMFLLYAVAYLYGGHLVDQGKSDLVGIMKAQMGIVFGAMIFSQLSAMAPDYSKAKLAAHHIFQLLDRVPPIDVYNPNGEQPGETQGNISFKDLMFEYPTRPGVTILNGFNLDVAAGSTVALVGASGCGKSTIMGLLQRFYEPLGGEIFVDGVEIKSLNLAWLRSKVWAALFSSSHYFRRSAL